MKLTNGEKLRKQVSALAKFGGQSLRSEDLDELLNEAARLVAEGVDVDLVKVLELLPDGRNLLVREGVNWKPGVVGPQKFRLTKARGLDMRCEQTKQ